MAQKKGKPTTIGGLAGGLKMSTSSSTVTAAAQTIDKPTPWLAYINEEIGATMYLNTTTEEVTWEKPAEGFEWGESFPNKTPHIDPEGLGNDYLEHPWVEPSLEQAIKNGEMSICLGGTGSLLSSITDMNSIGESGIVYFHFLKTLISTFFVMSLVCFPAILSNFSGSRIPRDQLDFSSVFSIANVGNFRSEYQVCTIAKPDRIACERELWGVGKQFSTSFFWPEGIDVAHVGSIYVWLDVASVIVFVLAMLHFYFETNSFVKTYRFRKTTTSDYAIQVWGLPPDALENEIIDHFNDLYNLQHKDHVERPKCIPELNPVGHYGNTCEKKYYISWVAECTIAYPTGNSIRKYKHHQRLSLQLREARAHAKKYCSQEFYDEKKYSEWDRKIQLLEWQIVKTLRGKGFVSSERDPEETVCAFVIFNNEESTIRALEDYDGSEYSWNRHFQPKYLRFLEEYPLIVKEAPDPADILWENLESSKSDIQKRRCITFLGTFFVLLASFTVIVTTLYYAAIFASNISRPLTCDVGIPYHYLSHVNNFTSNESSFALLDSVLPTSTQGELLYVRPATEIERAEKDLLCNAGNAKGTMRWLTIDLSSASNHFELAPITYDNPNVCDVREKCPGTSGSSTSLSTAHCPCIDSAQMEGSCDLECPYSAGCASKFSGRDVADCYCFQAIKRSFNLTNGLAGGVSSLFEQEPMCTQYAFLYITGRQLVNSVAFLVSFTNVIIEAIVKTIVPYEHTHSLSDLSGAISMKMYLALTLNTVLSPVLAKVRLFDEQANQTIGAQTQVTALPFSGDDKYVGFPVHWYSTVGTTLVTAMMLDIFVPHAIPILNMCFTRCLLRRHIRASHKSFVTQRKLNDMFVGPTFDMATRLGYVLNTCACTLVFSSGLPILIPCAMLSFFISYWVDKYMILRFYKKPPQMKSTTIIRAIATLPFVILLHFIISFLTLGDSTVLVSEKVFNWEASVPKDDVFLGQETLLLFANAADRQHMLPAFVSLCIVLACMILHFFPTAPLFKLLKCLRVLLGKSTRRVSENNPPFTGVYIKPILKRHYRRMENWVDRLANCCKYIVMSSMIHGDEGDGVQLELSVAEKMSGWAIREEKTTGGKFKIKEWRTDGYDAQGVKHSAGSLKRTWECIRDDGLSSYKIDQNPQYSDAMRTMYASKSKKKV